jgi:hypothetical protein
MEERMSLAAPRLATPAPDFALPGVDGKTWTLAEAAGPKGVLVMFICNHCPYVKAAIGRIVRDAAALAPEGIGAIAIMPNDTQAYPADSFANMQVFGRQHALPFPYRASCNTMDASTRAVIAKRRGPNASCSTRWFRSREAGAGRRSRARPRAAPSNGRTLEEFQENH